MVLALGEDERNHGLRVESSTAFVVGTAGASLVEGLSLPLQVGEASAA